MVLIGMVSFIAMCQQVKKIEVSEWKNGFAFDKDKNPLFFDDEHNESVNGFSWDEKDRIVTNGIINGVHLFFTKNELEVENSKAKNPTLMDSSIKLRYKIENNIGYVSKDGKKWEPLKVSNYNETGKKDHEGYPIIYVNFDCSFFRGKYQLVFGF